MEEKSTRDKNTLALYKEDRKKTELAFIASHPTSYLSPYLLRHHIQELSPDSAKMLYKNLDPLIQNSKLGKILYTGIQGKSLTVSKGRAPNFIRKDINGRKLSLSLFKEKSYVLLDFWASWCMPCRKNNPHLKSIYNKYHSKKLQIIGISIDADKNAWRNAVLKDKLVWYNILSSRNKEVNNSAETDDDISNEFGVTPIPVKILIDKNGIILGRYEGTKEEAALDKKLSEIFR